MSRLKLMYFILDQYLRGNDNFKFPNTTLSELPIDVSGSGGRTILIGQASNLKKY